MSRRARNPDFQDVHADIETYMYLPAKDMVAVAKGRGSATLFFKSSMHTPWGIALVD